MIKNITVEKILIYGILLFWTFICLFVLAVVTILVGDHLDD